MAIQLEYQYDSDLKLNIEAHIWHPQNYLETWIVLTNPSLKSLDGTLQPCNYSLIDFQKILEQVYNFYLPGLRVLSTKIFFIDIDESEYVINIGYSGQGIINTQSIKILGFNLSPVDFQDHRVRKVRELIHKLAA